MRLAIASPDTTISKSQTLVSLVRCILSQNNEQHNTTKKNYHNSIFYGFQYTFYNKCKDNNTIQQVAPAAT